MKLTAPEKVGFSATRLARINSIMQGYVDQQKLAGTVTLVARQGKVVHFAACGQADIAASTPMQTDALFRIYSMTKPITSVAAMLLWEEGHFHLSDPVAKFIPAFAASKVLVKAGFAGPELADQTRPMTIRDLMTHTAGLSYGFFQDSPVDELYRSIGFQHGDFSMAELVEKWASYPLLFQPGSNWRYSVATDVLGRIVEVISGRSLGEFFAERICKPLGMVDTTFAVPPAQLERFTTVYGPAPSEPLVGTNGIQAIDAPATSPFAHVRRHQSGGGGLISTTADYLRFCQMLLNGGELDGVRLLGRKTIELMTMNHVSSALLPLAIGTSVMAGHGFGLGFSVLLNPAEHQMPGSTGIYSWGGAANTNFWIDPKEQLIAILMTQFMPSDTWPVVADFRVAVYQALID